MTISKSDFIILYTLYCHTNNPIVTQELDNVCQRKRYTLIRQYTPLPFSVTIIHISKISPCTVHLLFRRKRQCPLHGVLGFDRFGGAPCHNDIRLFNDRFVKGMLTSELRPALT